VAKSSTSRVVMRESLLVGAVHGVDRAHPPDGVQGPHLREHVAGQGDFDVDAQTGTDTDGQGLLDGAI
jgi:hypothetical protein